MRQRALITDAIHNIPDLLTRWPDADEALIGAMLEVVGRKHSEWAELADSAKRK